MKLFSIKIEGSRFGQTFIDQQVFDQPMKIKDHHYYITENKNIKIPREYNSH